MQCHRSSTGDCQPESIYDIEPGGVYRIKIKALGDDINDLTVIAYDIDGEGTDYNKQAIPTPITITNNGYYGKSSQSIEVQMEQKKPWD